MENSLQGITFGYARVSTKGQNLDSQIDALISFGVKKENMFVEKASGVSELRPQFQKMLMKLREGDLVVFYDLSRIARNLKNLLNLVDVWKKTGVNFKSIREPFLDTKSAHGLLVFHFFGALNEFERNLNVEKTLAGIESAKKKGRVGGRPKGLSQDLKEKAKMVAKLFNSGASAKEIADFVKMAPASVYKCLRYEGISYYSHKRKGRKINVDKYYRNKHS